MNVDAYLTFDDLWKAAGVELESSEVVASRAGEMRETNGYCAVLVDPERYAWLCNPARKLNRSYGAAEMLWYLSGTQKADLVKTYAPSYEQFLDDGVTAWGAYGYRWRQHDMLRKCWTMLKHEFNTRRAVMTCYDPRDVAKDSKDVPCTLSLQFLLRDEELNLIVTMRSNDWWLGMPYDVWCFTRLQCIMASMLDVTVGTYQHQVGSLHVYEDKLDKAREALDQKGYVIEPENYRFAVDCPDTLEKRTIHALDLELRARTPAYVDEAVGHVLGDGTFFAEMVRRCREKWE